MTRVCFLGAWLLVGICFCSWIANAHIFLQIEPPAPGYVVSFRQKISSTLWRSIYRIPDNMVFGTHYSAGGPWPVTLANRGSVTYINVSMEVLGSMNLTGFQMKTGLIKLYMETVRAICPPLLADAVILQINAWVFADSCEKSERNSAGQQASANHLSTLQSRQPSQLNLPQVVRPQQQRVLHGGGGIMGLNRNAGAINPIASSRTQIQETLAKVVGATEEIVGHVEFPYESFLAQGHGVGLGYNVY